MYSSQKIPTRPLSIVPSCRSAAILSLGKVMWSASRAYAFMPPIPSRTACWRASRKSKTSPSNCGRSRCWPTKPNRVQCVPKRRCRNRYSACRKFASASTCWRKQCTACKSTSWSCRKCRSVSISAARKSAPTFPRSLGKRRSSSRSRSNPRRNSSNWILNWRNCKKCMKPAKPII